MVFLRDFESCQACIDELKTGCLDIHKEEPGDSKDDTQYVGIHGAFTTQEHQNLVKDHCLKEETMNMMVGMINKVNYNKDNSIC